MDHKDKLFIYTYPGIGIHISYQHAVGRAVALFLHKGTIMYSDPLFGEQHALGKLIGLAGEGRMQHLFLYQAEVLSRNTDIANKFIDHFRAYQVELYFGCDIIPGNDARFEYMQNPKYY